MFYVLVCEANDTVKPTSLLWAALLKGEIKPKVDAVSIVNTVLLWEGAGVWK